MGEEDKKEEEYDQSGQKLITLPIVGIKMREKTYVFFIEGATVLAAIISSIMAINAYNKMKAAATDVDSVVGTWEATPVGDVKWVQASISCPPGYEQIPVIQNKKSPLACACEIGSTKKLQGMSDQPA